MAAAQATSPQPTAVWHVLTVIWALSAVFLGALGHDLALGAVIVLFGGLLGLIWCVQLARVLLDREARGRLTGKAIVAWAVCPATGLILMAFWSSPLPLALRVRLSEQALLRLVEEVEAGRATFERPVRAGLFVVEDARVEDGCVFLETNEGRGLATDGIAYAPEGRPPGWAILTHLRGRWWAFYYPD